MRRFIQSGLRKRESFSEYPKTIAQTWRFCYVSWSPEDIMKRQLIAGLAVIGCVALALADDVKQGSMAKTNAPAATTGAQAEASYPVIGYLEKRDYVITIKAAPQGTIYSIATKDGKILHENVSAEQLKAKAPELYNAVKTGLANDARLQLMMMR
jgi:hypothetical protein